MTSTLLGFSKREIALVPVGLLPERRFLQKIPIGRQRKERPTVPIHVVLEVKPRRLVDRA